MKPSQSQSQNRDRSRERVMLFTHTHSVARLFVRSLIQTHVKKFKHTELQMKFKKNVLRECRRAKGTLSLIEEKENIHEHTLTDTHEQQQLTSFLALCFPSFCLFQRL